MINKSFHFNWVVYKFNDLNKQTFGNMDCTFTQGNNVFARRATTGMYAYCPSKKIHTLFLHNTSASTY